MERALDLPHISSGLVMGGRNGLMMMMMRIEEVIVSGSSVFTSAR